MYIFYLFIILMTLGFFVGRYQEKKHLQSLALRQKELAYILTTNLKKLPQNQLSQNIGLVSGSCVIANDYFKNFLASWRFLFGGEIKSYTPMLRRARQEAYIRMLEAASQAEADAIVNVRYETSAIGNSKNMAATTILAYGTALKRT